MMIGQEYNNLQEELEEKDKIIGMLREKYT